jgi:hypothetical protein
MKHRLQTVAEQAPALASSIIADIQAGKRQTGIEWGDSLREGKVTLKEMIGTDDGSSEFVEKVTYDLYQGREAVPLLYRDVYNTVSDPNFPQTMTAKEFGPVQVVFLQKYEGGEVKFGTIGPEVEKVVQIVTYAAGLEYDEDILEFNQTWRLSEIGEAFGEAYNKLLNHIHLYPIISGSYTTTGGGLAGQKAAQEAGTAQLVAWTTNLETTLRNALTVLPRGTKMLINSADRFVVEEAIAGSMYDDFSPSLVKRKLSSADIIEYDGDEVEVGGKTYTYTGVSAGFMYLLVPKRMFKEYVKHDLRVDSDDGDLSRLILSQVVGRARRGVFAALGSKYGAIKVDIAA